MIKMDKHASGPAGVHAANPPPLKVLDNSNREVVGALNRNGELIIQLMELIKESNKLVRDQTMELKEQRKELKEQRKLHGKLDQLQKLGTQLKKDHPAAIAAALLKVFKQVGISS